MEMLVVLVLTSMLSVLLIQGALLLYSNFSRVNAVQARISEELLPMDWFRDSVSHSVASLDEKFGFSGDDLAFEAYTASPVLAGRGVVTHATWSLQNDGDTARLFYKEQGDAARLIHEWRSANADFAYTSDGVTFYRDWPIDEESERHLPAMVRLRVDTGDRELEYLVAMVTRLDGVPDYRDMLE